MDSSDYYAAQDRYKGLVSRIASYARDRMMKAFLELAQPNAQTKILDIGVTCDRREDCNSFEKSYPYSHNLTAVGLEDASFLETDFPGLRYVRADALNMPFRDKEFEIATSWAVIEHVGSRERQKQFLAEMSRVSKSFFVTTPNRWYPVEFHTVTPFLHWLPPEMFRRTLNALGMPFYATEDNLNLLDERELLSLIPAGLEVQTRHMRLLGPISNLVIFASDQRTT